MWIANFLRALAQSIERRPYNQTAPDESTQNLLLHICGDLGDCKKVLENIASQNQQGNDRDLNKEDYLSLRLKEYEVLRAEQRTRLDAANRLIHYNVLVVGALIAGIAASYKHDNLLEFNNALLNALLMIPLISMPFAFTQWNDEIIVDRIADYISKIKEQVGMGLEYWKWEEYHNSEKPLRLIITAIIRSGFFPLSGVLSLAIYSTKNNGFPVEGYKQVMYVADALLITLGVIVSGAMAWSKIRTTKTK